MNFNLVIPCNFRILEAIISTLYLIIMNVIKMKILRKYINFRNYKTLDFVIFNFFFFL